MAFFSQINELSLLYPELQYEGRRKIHGDLLAQAWNAIKRTIYHI